MKKPFPTTLPRRHLVKPQDERTGVSAVFGSWPGDETDEEFLEALDRLDDRIPQREDKRYLAYVRRQACGAPSTVIKCGTGKLGVVQPHHFPAKGRAKRGDDRRSSPLCVVHHRVFHDRWCLPPFDPAQTADLFREQQLRLLIAYLDGAR